MTKEWAEGEGGYDNPVEAAAVLRQIADMLDPPPPPVPQAERLFVIRIYGDEEVVDTQFSVAGGAIWTPSSGRIVNVTKIVVVSQ